MNSIESLIIPLNYEHTAVASSDNKIIIQCIVNTQDPDHPTQQKKQYVSITTSPKQTIPELIKRVKKQLPNCSFGTETYLKFNYHYYKTGTLHSRGIDSNQTIEIISLESEQEATKNEGFIFAFWSLVPLMVSISFLVPGLIGTFDMVYRGLFILAGTIIGIPSSILLIIGITERYSSSMRISFVNYSWFGPCCDCSCCNCCGCCHCCSCCYCDQLPYEKDELNKYKKGKKSGKSKRNYDEESLIENQETLEL